MAKLSEKKLAANRKNAKKGGRKPGVKLAKTIALEATLADIKQAIERRANKLIEAQSVVALGTYKMVEVFEETNEQGASIQRLETVRDIKRMDELLETGKQGQDYFILEGSKPDWKAANALLDRGFGKAKESIDLNNPDGNFSLKDLFMAAEARKKKPSTAP